jgi:hypothetical protein
MFRFGRNKKKFTGVVLMFKIGDKVIALESVFEEREDDDGDMAEEEVIIQGEEYEVTGIDGIWLEFRYIDGEYRSAIFRKLKPAITRNLPAWF